MDKEIMNKYEEWLNSPALTSEEKEQLLAIKDDENEIIDRFAFDLEFGTGGLRGVMAVGANRMNTHTVRRASQGLAMYLLSKKTNPSVAIAYDSRNNSKTFAEEAANVLASNNVKVHLYKVLMPTPALSFAVRYLHCDAGIVVTASHNPKQYNGYKVYGSDGCQMTIDDANNVFKCIQKVDTFKDVKHGDFNSLVAMGKISYISDEVCEAYINSDLKQSIISEKELKRDVHIIYTPLHGAGLIPVTSILARDGFKNVTVVEEQRFPDGNFPTASYPNPEMKEALTLGIEYLLTKNGDILLATDPDSDRVGVVVSQKGKAIILTGNEVGILLFDFIVKMRQKLNKMPACPVVVKTIVSSDMVNVMAKEYGINIIEVLTGFKFIGEQILYLEQKGKEDNYIFGFEESCGYLTNTDIRDKDAVNACLLITEMANYYRSINMTLFDRLNELYDQFGSYKSETLNFEFSGLEGKEKIKSLMKQFRSKEVIKTIGEVESIGDYLAKTITHKDGKVEPTNLPSSNVIKFFIKGGETITIRPSGTEPKLKAYIFANGSEHLENYKEVIKELIA